MTCMVSQPPFSLIQNWTADLCASLAYLRAKHCICQRKALQLPTQSFATANAKLCNRQRKALQSPMQSFASAPTNVCVKRRLHLETPSPYFSQSHSLMCGLLAGTRQWGRPILPACPIINRMQLKKLISPSSCS